MPQGPVRNRIDGLDMLRGFALFGVLLVNNFQFMQPFSLAHVPVSLIEGGETGAWWVWSLIHGLFEFKFVALFSLLFGFGFTLQFMRSGKEPGYTGMYLRRLGLLALFGLAHAALLYAADILFIYACGGLILFLCRNWSGDTTLKLGLGLYVLVLLMQQNIGAGGIRILPMLAVIPVLVLVRKQRITRYLAVCALVLVGALTWNHRHTGDRFQKYFGRKVELAESLRTMDSRQITLGEASYDLPLSTTVANRYLYNGSGADKAVVDMVSYQQGPFAVTVFNRIYHFVMMLHYSSLYFGWRTLALFLIAGGIAKARPRLPEDKTLQRRWMWFGLGLGLPMTLWATFQTGRAFGVPFNYVDLAEVGHELSALLLAVGISGFFFLWADRKSSLLSITFSAVGRTALSNYIGQSVVMSTLACYYGAGLYGKLTHPMQLLISITVYVVLCGLSVAWLRAFRMGPLEWLWRTATYRRVFPLKRQAEAEEDAEPAQPAKSAVETSAEGV